MGAESAEEYEATFEVDEVERLRALLLFWREAAIFRPGWGWILQGRIEPLVADTDEALKDAEGSAAERS